MNEFVRLQELKVSRAKRLLSIVERISPAEIAGDAELVKRALKILAEHLPLLVEKIEAQKELCKSHHCVALIDEELSLFTSRRKDLDGVSLLEHVNGAVRGVVQLDIPVVVQALIVVSSREKSMVELFNTCILDKKAA